MRACDGDQVPRLRLLVTGFGAFPGTPRNPSLAVLSALGRYSATFARRGIELRLHVLPVLYDALSIVVPDPAPDVILHIGVAGSRRVVSLETRAHPRRSPRHPDGSGRAPRPMPGGAMPDRLVDPQWRVPLFAARLRAQGVPAVVSRDAGAYVCNALLYRSLEANQPPALFIHIPRARVYPPERIAHGLARTLPDVVSWLGRTMHKSSPS